MNDLYLKVKKSLLMVSFRFSNFYFVFKEKKLFKLPNPTSLGTRIFVVIVVDLRNKRCLNGVRIHIADPTSLRMRIIIGCCC